MKTHKLKTIQPYFDEVANGSKTFEFRFNDRKFKQYDEVILQEYDVKTETYSGREINAIIGFVLKDFVGIKEGYCIFSLNGNTHNF